MQRQQNVRSMYIRTIHVAFSMEESTVLYEYDEDLTVNSRTAGAHRKRRHVFQAYYIFLNDDFDVFCWFGQTDSKHILTGIQDWLGSLCYQCCHCNHKGQHFPVVESNILRVFDEKGY